MSNHQNIRGVATPLAAVGLTSRRRDSGSESPERSSKGSQKSIYSEEEEPKAKIKPEVAPKPGKDKPPPVAKVVHNLLSKLYKQ